MLWAPLGSHAEMRAISAHNRDAPAHTHTYNTLNKSYYAEDKL